jgi:hypothetical protein
MTNLVVSKPFLAFALMFVGAITTSAQWNPFQAQNNLIVNRVIGNAIVCDAYKKAGRRDLPAECSRGRSSSPGSGQNAAGNATARPRAVSAVFAPVSNTDSDRKFSDLGTSVEEKQLLLKIAATTRESYDQQNAGKGWKNNLAGAMTFFIVTTSTIYNGEEIGDAQTNALFKTLNLTMGGSFEGASNKDKTELYNTLISYAGLSLVFYAQAAQAGNGQQVEKVRQMVGGLVRTILKTEPEALKGLVN